MTVFEDLYDVVNRRILFEPYPLDDYSENDRISFHFNEETEEEKDDLNSASPRKDELTYNSEVSKDLILERDYVKKIFQIEQLSLREKAIEYINRREMEDDYTDPRLKLGFFQRDFLEELYHFSNDLFRDYISDLREIEDSEIFSRKIEEIGDFIFNIYDIDEYFSYPRTADPRNLQNYLSQRHFDLQCGKTTISFLNDLFSEYPEMMPVINEQYFLVNALLNDNKIELALEILARHPEPEFLEMVFAENGNIPYNREKVYNLETLKSHNFVILMEQGIVTKQFFFANILKPNHSRCFLFRFMLYFFDKLTKEEVGQLYLNRPKYIKSFIEKLFQHYLFDENLIQDEEEKKYFRSILPNRRKVIFQKYMLEEIEQTQEAFSSLYDEGESFRNSLVDRTLLYMDNENQRLFYLFSYS